MLDLSDRVSSAVGTPTETVHLPEARSTLPKRNFAAIFGTCAVLLLVMAISVATSYSSDAMSSGVDCIGDGAVCEGSLHGSTGEVRVSNNTNPQYHWRFKLTCGFGGDQMSRVYDWSPETVSSQLTCNFGAPATHWNVIVDFRP